MIQVSNSKDEHDRSLSVCSFRFVVVRITSSLEEEEEEEMPLERKKGPGFRALLAGRSKGSGPKDASGSELPSFPSANPFVPANLKKKKDKEVAEKGELVPYNEGVPPKMPKTIKGKGRVSSVEGKEVGHVAEVRLLNPAWNPRLELDGAVIP